MSIVLAVVVYLFLGGLTTGAVAIIRSQFGQLVAGVVGAAAATFGGLAAYEHPRVAAAVIVGIFVAGVVALAFSMAASGPPAPHPPESPSSLELGPGPFDPVRDSVIPSDRRPRR